MLWLLLVPHAVAQTPAGADAFLTRFRAAAANPDASTLADLTKFTFLSEGNPHERAAFIQRVAPRLLTPGVRKCLANAKPMPEDGRLVLWCKPYGFYLGLADGQWRLLEFGVDGEP